MKKLLRYNLILVSIFFAMCMFSYIYIKYLHAEVYLKYIPNDFQITQYDLKTHESDNAKNSGDNYDSFIPVHGLVMYKIYKFIASWGILLFIPFAAASFFLLFIKDKPPKIYYLVLYVELIIVFIVLRLIVV